MVGIVKRGKVLGISVVTLLGIAGDPAPADANMGAYICKVASVEPGPGSGPYGAIDVVIGDANCSKSLSRTFTYCSAAIVNGKLYQGNYSKCAADTADMVWSVSQRDTVFNDFATARAKGLRPVVELVKCKNGKNECPSKKYSFYSQ